MNGFFFLTLDMVTVWIFFPVTGVKVCPPSVSRRTSRSSWLPLGHWAWWTAWRTAAAVPPLLTAQCLLGNDGSLGSAQNANLAKPKLKGENVTRYDIMQYRGLLHKFTETLKKYCQLAPVAKAVRCIIFLRQLTNMQWTILLPGDKRAQRVHNFHY